MSAQQMRSPTAEGVARAAAKIAELLPQTPLLEAEINGTRVWLKAESLKPRAQRLFYGCSGASWCSSHLRAKDQRRSTVRAA